ncbi:ExbD/TolR family protein [Vannielia litorea]|uniref:Biopolymer transport protein ExbD n=1 Tax=Vannielia litorea TaxID=1217970 RepID=A0A1N6ENQ1_9RHOB|nr:biopolymer transporter ExbD [Vannielia litorea]SIN84712.1 Biopolymer transport protein ExbD [Vannielia litorea]
MAGKTVIGGPMPHATGLSGGAGHAGGATAIGSSGSRPGDVYLPDTRGDRKAPFALTPLADVMFQLLIFFMLSTSLAPYSLITLGTPAAPAGKSAAPDSAPGGGASSIVIWHVGRGELRAGSAVLPLDALPQLIPALKERGLEEILLFTTPVATTQDVATVIEAIRVGEVARLRLIGKPGL